ncbi:MAG: HAD family hydrolase [Herminiimonas sp.]|nr:HAD family hydrolase [Herminiimonas sp.]
MISIAPYASTDRLVIFDADGTTIDAFGAIDLTFARHGMEIGDLESFQKRRRLFKYLGGIRDFPMNLRKQFGAQSRKKLLATLTEVYREEACLYPGIAELFTTLMGTPGVRIGLVTRNITNDAEETLKRLFARHDVDLDALDFVTRIPVKESKAGHFRRMREHFDINPARTYVCGDEHHDYAAAIACGVQPFIVSYGFEDHDRLVDKFGIPSDIISRDPLQLSARVRHALLATVSG